MEQQIKVAYDKWSKSVGCTPEPNHDSEQFETFSDGYKAAANTKAPQDWEIYQKAQELDEKEFEQWMFDSQKS